jgi:predicted phosphodiesterase
MRISVVSDLHLEFADLTLPGGDILVLAGDVWTAAHMQIKRNDATSRSLRKRYEHFCVEELSKYRRALMVLGNHEFYGSSIAAAPDIIRNFLAKHAPNATLLDNGTAIIDGVPFIGSTLWAPCGDGNPLTELRIALGMNDFRQIKLSDGREDRFTPAMAAELHRHNVEWLSHQVSQCAGEPCVVITHHAPSLLCDSRGGEMAEAYSSNQHDIIERNPHVALWAYGHTHEPANLMIGNTKVVSNPRGYAGHEHIASRFDVTAQDFEAVDRAMPGGDIPRGDHG